MNETIGSRISAYRKAKGLTQEGLAEKLGVSSQAVSKWENDQSCPDISLLAELARILDITTDELLTGKGPEVQVVTVENQKPMEELVMHINVRSGDGDKVRMNIPVTLMQLGMNIGADFTGSGAMKNVDLNQVFSLVKQGVVGKLVEIESDDGDFVEIVVE